MYIYIFIYIYLKNKIKNDSKYKYKCKLYLYKFLSRDLKLIKTLNTVRPFMNYTKILNFLGNTFKF